MNDVPDLTILWSSSVDVLFSFTGLLCHLLLFLQVLLSEAEIGTTKEPTFCRFIMATCAFLSIRAILLTRCLQEVTEEDLVEIMVIVDIDISRRVQIISCAADDSESFALSLRLGDQTLPTLIVCKQAIDLFYDRCIENRRWLLVWSDVSDQFCSTVPLLDGLFKEWNALGEVWVKRVPDLLRWGFLSLNWS